MNEKTVSIKGGIYLRPESHYVTGEPDYTFVRGAAQSFSDYTLVCPHTLEFTPPPDFDPRVGMVAGLEAKRAELQREFTRAVCEINERIAKLQCIEFSGEPT